MYQDLYTFSLPLVQQKIVVLMIIGQLTQNQGNQDGIVGENWTVKSNRESENMD
jgi:hypothetical protein